MKWVYAAFVLSAISAAWYAWNHYRYAKRAFAEPPDPLVAFRQEIDALEKAVNSGAAE